MLLNHDIAKEIQDLQQISKFHDMYFQYNEKMLFRTRDMDLTKFWKEQFKEQKNMYDFFEQKQRQRKREQESYFSFRAIAQEFEKLWIE